MGFIKAFIGSLGGTFADQWKDFFVPGDFTPTTAVIMATKQTQNRGRGANTKASTNIISNGSRIIVPEGLALITLEDGKVTSFIAEPGGYEFHSDNLQSSSFFGGDGIFASTIKQSWDRFKFGGQPGAQQLAFYVNLKEIPNNRFGTQSEIYWDDAYLNTQVGAVTRGTYSLRIVDPILFVKAFVPASYLVQDAVAFDFADMDNDAGTQLFNEVVGSLASALSTYTNNTKHHRMSNIQADAVGFSKSLASVIEQNYQWEALRGIQMTQVVLQAIEYDEDTKALLSDVRKADALRDGRGNSFMQQSVARGMQNAGEHGGGANMAFMGMGLNGAGSVMGSLQQPESNGQKSVQDQLKEYKQLLDDGLISEDDYNALKAKLLGL